MSCRTIRSDRNLFYRLRRVLPPRKTVAWDLFRKSQSAPILGFPPAKKKPDGGFRSLDGASQAKKIGRTATIKTIRMITHSR